MKRNMDEREVMEMYKIEHYMFWFTFWILFASIIIQGVFFKIDLKQIAGEVVVFMIMAVISCVLYLRKGIYDTWSQPGIKSYLIYSVIFSLIATAMLIVKNYSYGYMTNIKDIIVVGVFFEAIMFGILFVFMTIIGEITKKRRKQLAEKYENSDEL